jgi:hypothetical protein
MGDNMSEAEEISGTAQNATKGFENIVENVQKAVKKAADAGKRSVVADIELGIALLSARNSLGSLLYKVITNDIIHRKKINRYLKMVAETSCDSLLENAPSDGDKGKLKTDQRIAAIKEEDIPAFKNPSHAKLTIMRHLSNKDFEETLSGGSQEAYNKKAEELHAQTDTGIAQADIKKQLEELHKDDKNPDESVELIMEMNKTALLRSYVEAVEAENNALTKLRALEEQNFDLQVQLKDAEDRCDKLETVRAERDQAFIEAGVIKQQASAPN